MEDSIRKEPTEGDTPYFSPMVSQGTLAFEEDQEGGLPHQAAPGEGNLPPPVAPMFMPGDLGQGYPEGEEGDLVDLGAMGPTPGPALPTQRNREVERVEASSPQGDGYSRFAHGREAGLPPATKKEIPQQGRRQETVSCLPRTAPCQVQ